jgi:leucyl aminopeptidase
MALNVEFVENPSSSSEILVVPVGSDKKFTLPAGILKQGTIDSLKDNLEADPGFKGKSGEVFKIPLPKGEAYRSVVFAGFQQDEEDVRPSGVQATETGSKLYPALGKQWAKAATFAVTKEFLAQDLDRDRAIAHLAQGLSLGSYKFDTYKTKKTGPNTPVELESVEIIGADKKAAEAFKPLKAQAEGVFLTRELANTPPNILFPERFAEIIHEELGSFPGLTVRTIAYDELIKMGAGGIVSVGQGSDHKPCIVVMEWKGKKPKGDKPLAFVGKGVTFDSGGLSIKPAAGMEDMKMDMHGAASVVGLMKTLALRGSEEHVVGVVGLAENSISGNSTRPSDIITLLNGKTMENLNTDAEGRIVLADCLELVQREFDPRVVIDVATLTGAIIVALGKDYTGVFANNDKLWQTMEETSKVTGEKLWRMPLDAVFRKQMEGRNADVQNMSSTGRDGGSCTAAGFLEMCIHKGRSWSHWDIAGTGMGKEGGTGVAVRSFDELVNRL